MFIDEHIKTFLEKFFASDTEQIQSLLFFGEEGLGKKTVALTFAKLLLCQAEHKSWNQSCACQNCQMFDKGLHPDFLMLEPINNNIEIEAVRSTIEFLCYKPQFASRRILIINRAERLRPEAQDTLLKTLEEPPENTLIILITSYPQLLRPTVLSRLLPIRFHRSPEQIPQSKDIEAKRQSLKSLLDSDMINKIKYLQSLPEGKTELLELVKNWLEVLHHDIPLSFSASRIKLARELLRTFSAISYSNINSRLLLENIFLNYEH